MSYLNGQQDNPDSILSHVIVKMTELCEMHSVNLDLSSFVDNFSFYFNQIHNSIFKILDLNIKSDFKSREKYENDLLKKKLDDEFLAAELNKRIKLLDILTNDFASQGVKNVELEGLEFFAYFLSFMIYSKKFDAISSISKLNKIFQIEEYLKELVEFKMSTKFDHYFIIRHKLFGFKDFLNKFIFDQPQNFSINELEILKIVKSNLREKDFVYRTLKLADRLSNTELKTETIRVFWYIFDELVLEEKIELIYELNFNREMKVNSENNSIEILYDKKSFSSEFIIFLNQLSSSSPDEPQV